VLTLSQNSVSETIGEDVISGKKSVSNSLTTYDPDGSILLQPDLLAELINDENSEAVLDVISDAFRELSAKLAMISFQDEYKTLVYVSNSPNFLPNLLANSWNRP
jgi:hypothetical protein